MERIASMRMVGYDTNEVKMVVGVAEVAVKKRMSTMRGKREGKEMMR